MSEVKGYYKEFIKLPNLLVYKIKIMIEYEFLTDTPAEEVVIHSLTTSAKVVNAVLPSRTAMKAIFDREILGPVVQKISRRMQRRRCR